MLNNRFNSFLNKAFKPYILTKEVEEFKAELYDNLLAHAEALKSNAGLSEDEIFKKCVDSLGDFRETLKSIGNKPLDYVRSKRFAKAILLTCCITLIFTVAYVISAFFSKEWGLCAVILFPSMFVALYAYFSGRSLKKNFDINRHTTTSSIISSYATIVIVALFFVLAFATAIRPYRAWVVFPFLPVAWGAAQIAVAKFVRHKNVSLFSLLTTVTTLAVAAFILVAVCLGGVWHPTWLIVLIGIIADIIIIMVRISKKMK